jgi:hypothetical protein
VVISSLVSGAWRLADLEAVVCQAIRDEICCRHQIHLSSRRRLPPGL